MKKHLFITEKHSLPVGDHKIRLLVLKPLERHPHPVPGVLWVHGGGYQSGSAEEIFGTRALSLVVKFGAVLIAPNYRLSRHHPYPAALQDCYTALLWLKEHTEELGVRSDQIMVGGESAGGGMAAALCMLARDRGEVNIAYQMPLYPMIDDRDTKTSGDNNGVFWNTRKNHAAWKRYLKGLYPEKIKKSEYASLVPTLDIPAYAAPARAKNLRKLPPCYSFVAKGEPFYAETVDYIERLKASGVPAHLDVFNAEEHAFDMLLPFLSESKRARARFIKQFEFASGKYSARN